MAHVANWKREEVKELKELLNSHSVIGIVDLLNIPARQMQLMRKSLQGKAIIRMAKKNLIDLALNDIAQNKENITDLSPFMIGQPAIVFTDLNSFKLYKILEDSKTPAPAKAGSIATADIVVPAGDTGFEPGPFLGELQQVGIPAKIDKGKITVQKDHVIVKEGEKVSKQVATTLTRLDINPMEVGINLRAAYEEETIYTSDILFIDEEKTLQNIQAAFNGAFNLSVNAAIPTNATVSAILSNAFIKARNLAVNAAIVNDDTIGLLIGKAHTELLAIASAISGVEGALDDELLDLLSNVASVAPVVVEEDSVEEEEEEEEEASEEDAAVGLGALFG
ncbi:MAG: 50S ribosomal protein L10 [Methanobrevibacter sp.]|jgi:large subunit ribosomal protein L10|nr:50S ribosomal protein L10 [Methanobrevibacter sp.]